MLCCKGRNVPTCLYAIFLGEPPVLYASALSLYVFSFCGRNDLTLLHEIFIGRK